jgi:hypothetical protein
MIFTGGVLMEITLTLPDSMIVRLEQQADQLNVSLDDLAWKFFSDGLIAESVVTTPARNGDSDDLPSLEEVIARIKATPPNPNAIIPPTKTLEEVVAYWEANPPEETNLPPEEWDRLWAAFEEELKAIDRADDLAEGRL